jgi:predicted nucleic acid-binding protein
MGASEVVSNTSPLIALSAIGALDLLGTIYECVHIPEAVAAEVRAGNVQGIHVPFPTWLRIEPDPLASERALLYELDDGEAHAILLARSLGVPLLMDERKGRRVAEHLRVRVTGTVGFLARCCREGRLPSFREVAGRLRVAGIHLSDSLIDLVARELGE